MQPRQAPLEAQHYAQFLEDRQATIAFFQEHRFQSDSDTEERSLRARWFQRLAAEHLYITYTAGHPVESLPPLLEALVEHVEHRQQMLAQYEQQPLIAPFAIDHWPDEYLECTQLFALCILLGRPDLLARVAAMMDQANFVASDTLYEDLLMRVLPDRHDVDEWFHDYCTPLVQAIYADTPEEASTLLATYCEGWYAAFEHAPWHDSHVDDDGRFVGYWAFEAAAIAYLYDIDDSGIDHRVYPRDLVDYARRQRPR